MLQLPVDLLTSGMRSIILLTALAIGLSTSLYADSVAIAKRDAALKEIDACLRRNEVSSKEYKNLNKNVETLEDLYRQGDKTVLPTLLQFAYLTDFFGESLIADPDAFLNAMSHLSQPAQQAVATGIAGRWSGLAHPRFDAIRATLRNIPNSSPVYPLAHMCLDTLEADNALFLARYFPPQSFAQDPHDILVRWYSTELYALGEKPLPGYTKDANAEVYRLMVLPTWGNAIAVGIQRHGPLYSLSARRLDGQAGYGPGKLVETKAIDLNADDSKTLETLIQNLDFFKLPTSDHVMGFDGDEWILEGVSQGQYHVIDRWCATSNTRKRGLTAFIAFSKFLLRESALSQGPTNKGHQLL